MLHKQSKGVAVCVHGIHVVEKTLLFYSNIGLMLDKWVKDSCVYNFENSYFYANLTLVAYVSPFVSI